MVGAARLGRVGVAVREHPQVANERELVLGAVDLAAEERGSRAVTTGLFEEAEGVVRRPGRPAEDANHEMRIVGDEIFQALRAEVRELQEHRAA